MIITVKQSHQLPQSIRPKRVAAYCRVSTMQEIQHHSLEAQRDYYEKLITSRPHWIFVGVYTDQASGRHNLKMQDFQRLLGDCRDGKIDLILVKSISRMGRNTVQFLQACTELNDLGVDVYFEVEKLHINDPQAVRLLTIYASLYQNESESKSALITWGIRARFANGSSGFANRPCYGYRRNTEGLLEIVPEEAETVRQIYSWHREGRSLRCISKALVEMGIKSPRGHNKWSIETIRKILNNEKYYGHVLLQKTYISNYFTGKQAVNNGVLERYLLERYHPSIVYESPQIIRGLEFL